MSSRSVFWFATGLTALVLMMSEPREPEPAGSGPYVPTQAECDVYPERAEPPGCERYHWKETP